MTANPDLYAALTPYGRVELDFPEDGGCLMTGPADAIGHLHDVIRQGTNAMGMSMDPETLEPAELVNFCQNKGSGVIVLEPLDELLVYGSAMAEKTPELPP